MVLVEEGTAEVDMPRRMYEVSEGCLRESLLEGREDGITKGF